MLIYEEVGEFDGGGQVADDRRGDEDQLHFLHYTTQTTVHLWISFLLHSTFSSSSSYFR